MKRENHLCERRAGRDKGMLGFIMFTLLCGAGNGMLVSLFQHKEMERGEYQAIYLAMLVGVLGGALLAKDWLKQQNDMLAALAKDKDLTIFNACIQDLANGCEGPYGYGTDGIMAMLTLTRAQAESCTLFAPTDSALCGEEFEAIVKVLRPRRKLGEKPEAARQSVWLSFMLNHICDECYTPEELASVPEVMAVSGEYVQISALRRLATADRQTGEGETAKGPPRDAVPGDDKHGGGTQEARTYEPVIALGAEAPATSCQSSGLRNRKRDRHGGPAARGKAHDDSLMVGAGASTGERWDFPSIRTSNGIIYKIDRVLTPGVLVRPAADID